MKEKIIVGGIGGVLLLAYVALVLINPRALIFLAIIAVYAGVTFLINKCFPNEKKAGAEKANSETPGEIIPITDAHSAVQAVSMAFGYNGIDGAVSTISKICRNLEPSPDDWFVTKNVDGGVEIVGLTEKAKQADNGALDLVLPEKLGGTKVFYEEENQKKQVGRIGGAKVVAIGEAAFLNEQRLKSVVIPEGIETIGKRAFCYCFELRTVVIPTTVKSIGEEAFYDCKSLEEALLSSNVAEIGRGAFVRSGAMIKVDPHNVKYSSEEGILFDKKRQILINFPISPISIHSESVAAAIDAKQKAGTFPAWGFQEYTIPETVKEIGDCAFLSCHGTLRVHIPKTVEKIGGAAFVGARVKVDVDPESNYYSSESGVLFDKNREILLHFPVDESIQTYAIPKTVKEIAIGAFYNCKSLNKVEIPDGVEQIAVWAFFGCSAIKEIVLPSTLKTYGDWAFARCAALENVIIPDGVVDVGKNAFYDCPSLNSPVMPKSVERESQTIAGVLFLTRYSLLPPISGDVSCGTYSGPFIDKSKRKVLQCEMPNAEGKMVKCYFEVEDVKDYRSIWWDSGLHDAYDDLNDDTEPIQEGWVITGYDSEETVPNVVVPSTIWGIKVVRIGDKAFYSTDATSVVFPEGVRFLGHRVFRYCDHCLRDVFIPKSVTNICDEFIYDCAPILHVHYGSYARKWARELGRRYQTIPNQDGSGKFPDDWFSYKEIEGGIEITQCDLAAVNNGEIILPSTINGQKVVAVGSYVLPVDLERVVVSEGIEAINRGAFNCYGVNIGAIIIPKSVMNIGEDAFGDRWKGARPKLYVATGSYAEEWAREHNMEYECTN